MPQMAPLNWLSLFMLIIMIFLIFNVLNYYSFLQPIKSQSYKFSPKKINWKW
uniref:ATP synthase complex subunit 8 n=1 Tax=Popillia mutans TaxID=1453201 RepID=A0A7T1M855_9SCAR|nr:ATP synthase F0 subunit 8 [Popillia mutans]QPN54189.1 ATP synthase F0 subunit 8 [Popillia mutans]